MRRIINSLLTTTLLFAFAIAQEKPPAPSAPRSASVPPVVEKKLPNGLKVAVVEKHSTPIVTIQMLITAGASAEDMTKAGLANLTADLLTKGTKTRTATQIAEQIEALGGTINSGAGWNSSSVTVNVTSDKVQQALAILSDVILHPKFDQKELDLLRSQTLDELTANLKQPSFLANYVASRFTFGEHPAGGTPESIKAISRKDVVDFHEDNYRPDRAVLVFTGDIGESHAMTLARTAFGAWKAPRRAFTERIETAKNNARKQSRILVVDLPKSGQAAVVYAQRLGDGRLAPAGAASIGSNYYPALVLNSVLGGGYSSRLNYEIRIKRGLSYGAGSSFAWRTDSSNFSTRIQTKNQSAAEVVDLVLDEIKKLTKDRVGRDEIVPRASVLTGTFGRNLETSTGLANAIADLYAFGIPTSELNSYVSSVNGVTDDQIKSFAAANLLGGDIVIVGDYSIFKDDLAKRFPKMSVQVIPADQLDISKDRLQK